MGSKPAYEILGIGSPVVDLIVPVQEDFLRLFQLVKGGSDLIDYPQLRKLLRQAKIKPTFIPGGSSANTIKGLAQFGHKCALVGKVGSDEAGTEFIQRIKSQGITSLLIPTETPTAQALCLLTSDGERTFRTYLGAGQEMKGDDLNPELFEGVKLVHIEGYSLTNEHLTLQAMRLAKKNQAKISFDLASFEIALAYRRPIVHLISQFVDVLFANSQEVRVLTNLDPEKGCDILKDMCETVVVFIGKEGCWVGQGLDKIKCPAYPVTPVDTTGAGDLFASGFLHGYLRGLPLTVCAHYGALASRAVVQVLGAEIPSADWQDILKEAED